MFSMNSTHENDVLKKEHECRTDKFVVKDTLFGYKFDGPCNYFNFHAAFEFLKASNLGVAIGILRSQRHTKLDNLVTIPKECFSLAGFGHKFLIFYHARIHLQRSGPFLEPPNLVKEGHKQKKTTKFRCIS